MLAVRLREVTESNLDPEVKVEVMVSLLKQFSEQIPLEKDLPVIATRLFRYVKEATSCKDPYSAAKKRMNTLALNALPEVRLIVEAKKDPYEGFRTACIASIVGNVIDPGVTGHIFNLEGLVGLVKEATLSVDDTRRIFDALKETRHVLFLCDNAGEIAFDTLLVEEIKRFKNRVTVVVKEGPYQNDATLEDAYTVSMDRVADELITTGTDASALLLDDYSQRFHEGLKQADLVILKGMAYYETVEALRKAFHKKIAVLLRVKCRPVAKTLKVEKDANVALLLE